MIQSLRLAAYALLAVAICGCETPPDRMALNRLPESWGGGFAYGGRPQADHDVTTLENLAYVMAYDQQQQRPRWAAFRLFREYPAKAPTPDPQPMLDDRVESKRWFEPDEALRHYTPAPLAMPAPIAHCYGRAAAHQTWLSSNLAPQGLPLQTAVWPGLSGLLLEWASDFEELWVVTGPIYPQSPRLMNGVRAIPARYFVLVVDEYRGVPEPLALVIPQRATIPARLQDWTVSVAEIENLTGLTFFSEMPPAKRQQLLHAAPSRHWDLTTRISLPPVPTSPDADVD